METGFRIRSCSKCEVGGRQLANRRQRPICISDSAPIYADAVINGTATFELEPPTEAEMTARMRHLTGGGYPYLTAELDGGVAGYAYAGPYRIRSAYRFTVENSVYVAPVAKRLGVGRAAAPVRRPPLRLKSLQTPRPKAGAFLFAHDPEKWKPVFGSDHAPSLK